MTATHTHTPPALMSPRRKRHHAAVWVIPAAGFLLVLAPVVLFAGAANPPCTTTAAATAPTGGGAGAWLATAYGPPWGGIQGDGITATGLDLTAGQPAYEIAVDPAAIPLRTFVHITPNPYGTARAFYAGDTGGAITGRHVDIYDWHGRAAQLAWGQRPVTVTPAPAPGTGSLLGEITPDPTATTTTESAATGACPSVSAGGPLVLTPGQIAEILPDGTATAPQDAPAQVKLAIAAANVIIDRPYLWGGGHGQPLTQLAAGYDCSGATSVLLHAAGLLGDYADDSTQLETWGQPGPGQWITVYANSRHAFVDIAGIVLDTAWYAPVQPTTPDSGPRWQPASIIPQQYAGDQAGGGGGGFVQRHPESL